MIALEEFLLLLSVFMQVIEDALIERLHLRPTNPCLLEHHAWSNQDLLQGLLIRDRL
jgi:hypothetical protein